MVTGKVVLAGGICLLAAGMAITGLVVMVVGGEPGSRAYVVREQTGQLVVDYRSCPGEGIAELVVTDRTVSPVATVWEVSRSGEGDARTSEMTFGQVPGGFDEVREFVRPVPNHTLRFELTSTAGRSETVEFQLDRLPTGEFWDAADTRPAPVSELDRRGSKYC